ncbi:DUF1847 domain-containing protein [Desulfuromonas acetoxidans]|uniref:DUF1847 domain-containing protein n=1 Tax=Desulfuromonas acetoxidans TaxID=891 RepID=UPI002930A5FF|nr:DUF1847 domain-containing protein [Desulfuromonas acetoxidans]
MTDNNVFSCQQCSTVWSKTGKTFCTSPDGALPQPAHCPAAESGVIDEAFQHYVGTGDDARLAQVAARVEGMGCQANPDEGYVTTRWTRVEETIAFAKLMGFHTIGIATCLGLLLETEQLVKILKAQGFDVVTVCCKAGGHDKRDLGLAESDKVRPEHFEAACHPIAQAELLNRSASEMNILVGLCVGHDMLFNKYSKVPVTTLVAKDRVTGHNPASVLYGQNFCYKRLQKTALDIPTT